MLSPNFLESGWSRLEFRTAIGAASHIIVILLDGIGTIDHLDPELSCYLGMNTYIEWGDPHFFDKLTTALEYPDDCTQIDPVATNVGVEDEGIHIFDEIEMYNPTNEVFNSSNPENDAVPQN